MANSPFPRPTQFTDHVEQSRMASDRLSRQISQAKAANPDSFKPDNPTSLMSNIKASSGNAAREQLGASLDPFAPFKSSTYADGAGTAALKIAGSLAGDFSAAKIGEGVFAGGRGLISGVTRVPGMVSTVEKFAVPKAGAFLDDVGVAAGKPLLKVGDAARGLGGAVDDVAGAAAKSGGSVLKTAGKMANSKAAWGLRGLAAGKSLAGGAVKQSDSTNLSPYQFGSVGTSAGWHGMGQG